MGIGDFMKPEQRGSVSLLLTEDTFLLLVLHVPSGWQLRFLGFPSAGKASPARLGGGVGALGARLGFCSVVSSLKSLSTS